MKFKIKFVCFILLLSAIHEVTANPVTTEIVTSEEDEIKDSSIEVKLSTTTTTTTTQTTTATSSVSPETGETENQNGSERQPESTASITTAPGTAAGDDDVLDEEDATDDQIEKQVTANKLDKEMKRVPKASGVDDEAEDDKEEANTSEESTVAETETEAPEPQLPENHVIVETGSGDVEGFKQKVLDKDVYTFLGIPYARPPIGNLRFKLPEIVKPWRRPYKALEWPPLCEQTMPENFTSPVKLLSTQMSEDCLYLNIWTQNLDKTKLKPVMVWFHGGWFSFGSAGTEENDGKVLASLGDVVVVSFNYRLSAYGFLKLGSDAPGNMGLFDQNMALKWIHANIDEFGGDPSLITLFGQAAGAFSIGVHIASPHSRNLFKRAILQSGSPVHLSNTFESQAMTAEKLVDSLGCNNEDADIVSSDPMEALSCIQNQPTNSLKDGIKDVLRKSPFTYMPTIGGRMVPLSPVDTFEDPTYYYDIQKEIMIGVNNDDGSLYLNMALPDKFPSKAKPEISKDDAKMLFNKIITKKWPLPENYRNHLEKFFADFDAPNADSDFYTKNLYRLFTENLVTCPVTSFANNFAQIPEKSVYMYNFTHRSSQNPYADWVGVNTYEEVPFIFGVPILNADKYTPEEVEFSKRMLNTWVTFAKEGKPPSQLDKEWPKYDPTDSKQTMELNPKSAEVTTGMDKNCQFFHITLNTDNE